MMLCQISDLHIKPERKLAYGVVDTATMLERCVAQVNQLPQQPDAVIATGDLVDGGTAAEYSLLRDEVLPRMEKAVEQSRYAYERGRYSYVEWAAAQGELLELRRSLLDAAAKVHQFRIEIERLTGAALSARI